MNNKPLTANDLKVGDKYLWKGELLEYKYYSLEHFLFTNLTRSGSVYGLKESDFVNLIEYTEPNQTTMEYTEQPFNLETALKHPEWVRTRDGREIDFWKHYPQKDSRWDIIAVTSCGLTVYVSKDGFQLNENNHKKTDLILRVPYRNGVLVGKWILKDGKFIKQKRKLKNTQIKIY